MLRILIIACSASSDLTVAAAAAAPVFAYVSHHLQWQEDSPTSPALTFQAGADLGKPPVGLAH